MDIIKRPVLSYGIESKAFQDKEEIGRARLYVIGNGLHTSPYAYIEDIFVSEGQRSKGVGTMLVDQIIHDAKSIGCYKIIACSRFENRGAHGLYEKFNLKKWGFEFRLDMNTPKPEK